MTIVSTIITVISTLLGVSLTLYFTNKREENRFLREVKLKEFNDMKSFYVSMLSVIEQARTFTKYGKNFDELFGQHSLISAQSNIIAPDNINEKLADVSRILNQWSTLHKNSLPTKLGDTSTEIISNVNSQFRQQADDIYPKLLNEMSQLVILIKIELRRLKEEL